MVYFDLNLKSRCALATGLTIVFSLTASHMTFAQSTPTELADMALEDLLNVEVLDRPDSLNKADKGWTFSYTYRKLSSGGYRTGTQDLSFDEVLFSPGESRTPSNYPVVPTFICQNVHALSAGYAVNDKFSLSIVVPYITQTTDHISSVPGFSEFALKSDGIGDIALNASYQRQPSDQAVLQFNAGIRIPTGSIDITGDTPRNGSGTLERLPYTMQIGSGTFDFTGGLNYSRYIDVFKFGINANTTLRTGKNEHDYRLGNNYGVGTWLQYASHHWFQPGVKLSLREIERIKGADASLRVPAAFPFPASITNPDNFGGTKAHLSAFVKICPKDNCDVSLNLEYGEPVYQNLNGIQPKDRRFFSASAAVKF